MDCNQRCSTALCNAAGEPGRYASALSDIISSVGGASLWFAPFALSAAFFGGNRKAGILHSWPGHLLKRTDSHYKRKKQVFCC